MQVLACKGEVNRQTVLDSNLWGLVNKLQLLQMQQSKSAVGNCCENLCIRMGNVG